MNKLPVLLILIILLASCGPKTELAIDPETMTTPETEATSTAEKTEVTTTASPEPTTMPSSEAPEVIEPSTIYMIAKDDVDQYILIDTSGERASNQTFSYGDYINGSSFATMTLEEGYVLVDLKDLSTYPAEDANGLAVLIADKVYGSDIVPYMDPEKNLYGYRQNDNVLVPPIYTSAGHFKDGYAVVLEGQSYDGHYSIVDTDFKVHYTNTVGLISFGHGYFGQVYDYAVYNNWYNKFNLINTEGKSLSDDLYFEANVISEDLLLVGDHLNRWYINASGDRLPIEDKELLALPMKAAIYWTGDLYVAVSDPYTYDFTKLYGDDGQLLYSNETWQGPFVDILGQGLTLEHQTLVEEKFTTITLPQLFSTLEPSRFDDFNQAIMTNYFKPYEPEPVDMVSIESDTDFDTDLHGHLLDINFYHYWYGFGAAHPNHSRETLHLDLTTGLTYTLDDLSKDPETLYAYLTELVQTSAKENDPEAYWSIDEIMVDANTQYRHTEDGLIIYFSPYEISAYAFGYPEFLITYDSLTAYLNMDSAYYLALETK